MIVLGRKFTVVLGARGNKFVLGAKSTIFNTEDEYRVRYFCLIALGVR
jgi:hypothetical protein